MSSIEEGGRKNIKWAQDLGSKAYGGPVVADGKIFVGTNNANPRNPKIKGDKGILLCFRQSDGKFLWQAVHDKLPAGRVNDWPDEGICSSPVVEGKRLYYVSNRCELVCADTEGFLDGKNDGVQDEKYKDKTDADIIWRLDMIKELGVYPRQLASCSPVIGGDLVFVITDNGVDDELGMSEAEQGDDAESIARWIAEFDAIPPLQMTPDEEAAWQAARDAQKELEKGII